MSDGPAIPAGPDLASYDVVIVALSGGKDSIACLLHLLEAGVPRERIELVHHDVDGREGSTLMDWPCTRSYCEALARALEVPLFFSWKVGGFEGEMFRRDAPTGAYAFETPEGLRQTGGKSSSRGTRLRFPQVSPDLSVRWCSAYLKIMVMDAVIRGQDRFLGRRILVVTGERAEESASRARYAPFEPHRTDLREGRRPRHVDHWRPVHGWPERDIWAILERWGINPHPAYRLGFSRVSCLHCIFANANQRASELVVDPTGLERIAAHETAFGVTIHRKLPVLHLASQGTAYPMDEVDLRAARASTFDEPILLPSGAWKLPRGAYGDGCGPS